MTDLIRREDAIAAARTSDFRWDAEDAIAALPAVTVEVKPLVWDDRDYEWCWWSEEGDYRVRLDGAFHCDKHGVTMSSHTSLETAKSAVQADYEARILAALDEAEARAVKAEAEVEKLLGAQRRIQNLPDEIEQQVQITRAYAADSGMDRSQLTCMEICTSHFISHARTLRAHLGAKP